MLREFSIRKGSGGKGKNKGGDGVIREMEPLRPLTVSILSERRVLQVSFVMLCTDNPSDLIFVSFEQNVLSLLIFICSIFSHMAWLVVNQEPAAEICLSERTV